MVKARIKVGCDGMTVDTYTWGTSTSRWDTKVVQVM